MTRAFLASLTLCTLVGCGSQPKEARTPEDVEATENAGRQQSYTAAEQQVLTALDKLAADAPQTVAGSTVTAGAPYSAASGQRCRSVLMAAANRLACHDEQGWYFVTDVFGTEAAPEGQ